MTTHTDTGGTVPAVPPVGDIPDWCVICAQLANGATCAGDPVCDDCVADMGEYEVTEAGRRIDDATVLGGRL